MTKPSLILFALLLSCGPVEGGGAPDGSMAAASSAAGPAVVVAGARLAPMWMKGADGSRVPWIQAFYDTQRKEVCFVQLAQGGSAAAGPWICAPDGARLDGSSIGQYVRFTMERMP